LFRPRYYPGIYLKRLKKNKQTSVRTVVAPGRDRNRDPAEYTSQVALLQPPSSVTYILH
jgi:hypothetical protein